MTLKEAIYYTMKKHPDPKEGYNCSSILNTYFNIRDGKRIRDEIKLTAFSSKVDGKEPRKEMEKLKKEGIIKELEIVTGLKMESAGLSRLIRDYSLIYNNSLKNNAASTNQTHNYNNRVANQNNNMFANSFETLRLTFAEELKRDSYENVRKGLKEQCETNVQTKYFVEQAAQWMRMNYAIFYNQNDLDLYLTFVNDNWNYYDIYMEKQSSNLINKCKQNTDSIMDRCGTGYKVRTLYLLYNKDEGLLPYLPSDINIDFKDAKVSIISNAVRASLINLDFETQHRIKDLYNGKSNDEIEEYSLRLQKIISFIILGQDYVQGYDKLGVYTLDITSDDVINNINRLSDSDIRFLCDLYVVTNNGNSKGKELLRNADSDTRYSLPSDKNAGSLRHYDQKQRDYLINSNINKNNNLSKLLSIVESNDFVRKLDEGSYHM